MRLKLGFFTKFVAEISQQPGGKQMKKTHWLQKLLQVNGNEIHGTTRSDDRVAGSQNCELHGITKSNDTGGCLI